MTHYYNEFDPFASKWLRKLFPAAEVDARSIEYVEPEDLVHKRRCHFFAGIGGWELALQLAGWPEDQEVWTGSCPCQPFSVAGAGEGEADERHLWPEFFRLIAERRPAIVFGEQVANAVGHGWLDGVFADLEGQNYACGAVVLGAHSAGAPHIRQRLFWVADSCSTECGRRGESSREYRGTLHASNRCGTGRQADADGWNSENGDLQRSGEQRQQSQDGGSVLGMGDSQSGRLGINGSASGSCGHVDESGPAIGLADSIGARLERFTRDVAGRNQPGRIDQGSYRPTTTSNAITAWDAFSLIECSDGKPRRIPPIESGIFPLADGVPNRVGRLRGYGNAIVPQVAAMFIRAFMDTLHESRP